MPAGELEFRIQEYEYGIRREEIEPVESSDCGLQFHFVCECDDGTRLVKKRAQHFSAGLLSFRPARTGSVRPRIPCSRFRLLLLSPAPNVFSGIRIEFGHLTFFGRALHVVHVVADNLFGLGVINHDALCAG
jgi:hypothetical protein